MSRLPSKRIAELVDVGELAERASKKDDHSIAGEWSYISSIIDKLGIAQGFVADIAASDGVSQSCTLPLFRRGWSGFALEVRPAQFARLAYVYSAFADAHLARARVTPTNVVPLLTGHEVPKNFEFLNLDIDSYDLSIMQAMLAGHFRPQVISMEINEKIPPPIYFEVRYADDHIWAGDHFYGCSISAACELLKPSGYSLVGLEYNNAFFVRDDVNRERLRAVSSEAAYISGYRDRTDRRELFPWNDDMEEVLTLSPDEALAFVRGHFANYGDRRFELRLAR